MMNKNQAQDFVPGMDEAEFRRRGKEMIDYIADYLSHIKLEFSSDCSNSIWNFSSEIVIVE